MNTHFVCQNFALKFNFKLATVVGLLFMVSTSSAAPLSNLPKTPQCNALVKKITGEVQDKENGLQTDQIVLNQNGKTLLAWSDGVYKLNSLHSLWSASKTVTATLVGAAIQKGHLKLDDNLSNYFPKTFDDRSKQALYDSITIRNLLNMTSGFSWDESYESDPVNSTFIHMLYGPGRKSMKDFALNQPMEIEPGRKFNYSGGNSNILMAILNKIYGNSNFAEELLFKPLGINSAFFERDAQGNLIGSSYAYMTIEEMAILGEMYLNNGVHKGIRILPEDWIKEAKIPTEGVTRTDNVSDPKYIKAQGVFSQRTFWLNQDAPAVKMENEFKNSPKDMFFAAGHYGQLILMIPSQKIVFVMTGHNKEYWSKIDSLVHSITSCVNPKKTPGFVTSQSAVSTTETSSTPFFKQLKLGSAVLRKGVLQAILAKEICSCYYVSGLPIETCMDRANLPLSKEKLKTILSINLTPVGQGLKVDPTPVGWALGRFLSGSRQADYLGAGLGCKLN